MTRATRNRVSGLCGVAGAGLLVLGLLLYFFSASGARYYVMLLGLIALPAVNALWLQFHCNGRVRELTRPGWREELALTRIDPAQYLRGELRAPVFWGLLPFGLTMPPLLIFWALPPILWSHPQRIAWEYLLLPFSVLLYGALIMEIGAIGVLYQFFKYCRREQGFSFVSLAMLIGTAVSAILLLLILKGVYALEDYRAQLAACPLTVLPFLLLAWLHRTVWRRLGRIYFRIE